MFVISFKTSPDTCLETVFIAEAAYSFFFRSVTFSVFVYKVTARESYYQKGPKKQVLNNHMEASLVS